MDEPWRDPTVSVVRHPSADYGSGEPGMVEGVERLARLLGWWDETGDVLGNVVPEDARVVIKPNWVRHENHGPWGIDPLLTHASLVRAVTEAALESRASEVLVGDAPLQSCDFGALTSVGGLREWADDLARREPRFAGIHDFRRTVSVVEDEIRHAEEDRIPLDEFVLFDLGEESLLEPITDEDPAFRVTQYDPRYMERTHRQGRHRYLVSRHIMEADLVVNLPKLKTHKKAGITCALKNLIGINGNKEFLPHHRMGSPEEGGDCYPHESRLKRWLEGIFDRLNMASSPLMARTWRQAARAVYFGLRLKGDEFGIEGSWSGNDTIWRTCLDLNRILLYGRVDGSMAQTPQRRTIHLVDAVIGGQGDGPLSPEPLPLGLLMASGSAPAMDWVGSLLLGYDPRRIPITSHAFDGFRWPIASFAPDDVNLRGDLGEGLANQLVHPGSLDYDVRHPLGWQDAAATGDDPAPARSPA